MTDEEAVDRAVRAWRGEIDASPAEVLAEHVGGEVVRFDGGWFRLARKVFERVGAGGRTGAGHTNPTRTAGAKYTDKWSKSTDNLDLPAGGGVGSR